VPEVYSGLIKMNARYETAIVTKRIKNGTRGKKGQRRKTMDSGKKLYKTYFNPLLIDPDRPLPKEIAVIGAGTIGPDIGYYLKSALPDITMYLVDVAEKPLIDAEARLKGYLQKGIDRKKMTSEKAEVVGRNIVYTTDYEQIKNCELVIEAATENIPLKQQIFARIEDLVSGDTIITSNTSSIPADRIFSNMRNPARTAITHFFAPAWRTLPVEVVGWERTQQATVDYLYWFFAATGKAPVITDNAICFMLDRVFDNWCNEAAYLIDSATASQVDKVAEEFVFAGPFFVLNMANGNPIIVETNTLQMEEGAHYKPAHCLNSVDRWKTHRPGTPVTVDEETKQLVRDRMLAILFSQSFDIIDRGIGTMKDLNFGCQVALGFRQGPFDIMRQLGDAEVGRIMERFANDRPGFPQPKQPLSAYQDFNRYILVDDMDGVKVITIRRLQAMNALNDEMTDEILSVFEQYADDPAVNGFVITGYGLSAFSAGADIGKFPQKLGDHDASVQYAVDYAKVQCFMDQMEKPVVAALNGIALGGGMELAIRCHGIVAVKTARLQFPEISLGILPGLGGCTVPYRKWPRGADIFNDMIILGKPLSASQAADIGMIDVLVDDYDAMIKAALAMVTDLDGRLPRISDDPVAIPEPVLPDAATLAKHNLSAEAVAVAIKTIKTSAAAGSLADALESGYQGFGNICCTDAAREGISAFLEKRKPVFKK